MGYGLESHVDFNTISPGLKFLLDDYKFEISAIKKQKVKAHETIVSKWKNLTSGTMVPVLKSYVQGEILTETKWGQGSPSGGFNRFCPKDPSDTSSFCKVGCGGVALGQLLYYWSCRVFPDNSVSYTPDGFSSSITKNFYNQSYNWNTMNLTTSDDDNAKLLYHAAVAVESDFGATNTESNVQDVKFALLNYFGFNANPVVAKSSFSSSAWIDSLKTEINSERLVLYYGAPCDTCDGHIWLVDGYKSTNEFHCNWGWNGSYDDWYLLSDLTPTGHNYNSAQGAIMNIYPKLDACTGLNGSNLICSSNESYSVTIPSSASVSWSKSSNLDQVGGNTGTTYTVNEGTTGIDAPGSITATIKNSQGSTFLTRTKSVWVGAPYVNPATITFNNSEASSGNLCANSFGNNFSFSTQSEWNSFDIKLTNLAETQTYCSFTIYDTQGDLDICSVSDGTYRFWVRGTNDCGTAGNWSKTSVVFEDCMGLMLMMVPNPSSSETTLTIQPTSETYMFDPNTEWEVEVYTESQVLKEKKTKIKGKSAVLKTDGWKEGVYFVKAKYKDQLFQGKLLVKK